MSTTKIVLNRQSDLILTNATITAPVGLVKGDIDGLVADLIALGLADAAEEAARIAGDGQLQAALEAAEIALNAAIQLGDATLLTNLENYKSSNDAALASEIELRIAGDVANDSAIKAEEARALAAELGLANDIEALETEHAADVATLQSNIDNEQARAEAAELVLTNSIAKEVSDRIDAVSNEATLRTAADADLKSKIDAEESRAKGAETVLQSNIDVEKGRVDAILLASDADKDSFAEIVALINSVDTTNDQAFASYVLSNDAALAQEVSDRTDADADLQSQLDSEVVRATGVEDQLSIDLTAEKDRAIAAEGVIQSSLDAEIANRTAADTAFTNSLNNEIADRVAGDLAVQANVDGEATRAINAEGVLRTDLATEISDRITAVGAESTRAITAENKLNSDLNAEVTRATGAEGVLTDALNAEVVRATGAEAALQTNLDDEADLRSAGDALVLSQLDAEVTRAMSAESVLTDAITAESHRAMNAEYVIVSTIGYEEAGQLHSNLWTEYNDFLVTDWQTQITQHESIRAIVSQNLDTLSNIGGEPTPESPIVLTFLDSSGAEYSVSFDSMQMVNDYSNGFDNELNNWDNVIQIYYNNLNIVSQISPANLVNFEAWKVYTADQNLYSTEAGLQSQLDTEVDRATKAEKYLEDLLNAEVTRATETDRDLLNQLNSEISRANKAENALLVNIDVEKGRVDAILLASDADKDSFAEIVALVNSVDTTNDQVFAGYVLSNDAALAQEVSDRTNADADLSDAIAKEVTERSTAVSKESDGRIAADVVLTDALNAEVTRATGVEVGLSGDIKAETTRATGAETLLQSNIDAVISDLDSAIVRLEAADDVLDGKIADIISNVDVTSIDSFTEVISTVNTAFETTNTSIIDFTEANRPSMVGFNESPNGVLVDFTADVVVGTEIVFLNGLMQLPGVDYTITTYDLGGFTMYVGTKVTFMSAPVLTDKVNIYGVSTSVSHTARPTAPTVVLPEPK